MFALLCLPVDRGAHALRTDLARYALLERASRTSRRLGVELLAFGLADDEVQLLLCGDRDAVGLAMRGVKGGTVRAAQSQGVDLRWGPSALTAISEEQLEQAVATVHSVGASAPLATPWTSHRDLLGLRRASFFDAAPLRRRVRAHCVHARLGGGELPSPSPSTSPPPEHPPLPMLLRVAASCLGVLPADRRCFGLFAQLASACGWLPTPIAAALALTPRRVRQLKHQPEPALPLALSYLSDARLQVTS